LTGEDIYLKEDFINLCRNHSVRKIHPDLATAGGILETNRHTDVIDAGGHCIGSTSHRLGARGTGLRHQTFSGLMGEAERTEAN
jgi:L-alanine-DL-glutamate epimerase-like enolase superfamily enzyme